jgi:hypothetical protein
MFTVENLEINKINLETELSVLTYAPLLLVLNKTV